MATKKLDLSYERQLFDLIEKIGEQCEGDLHIIDSSAPYPEFKDEATFRVYHKDGYCFDVYKRAELDENENFVKWNFEFIAEWEGFKKLKYASTAIELINAYLSTQ